MTHAPFQTGSEGSAGADVMIVFFSALLFVLFLFFVFGGCWCGTCSESVFHHQLTLDICNEILTFVSVGTFLLSGSASLAIKLIFALLVENAVIVFLLKGKPLAVLYLIALFNAFLKGGDGK